MKVFISFLIYLIVFVLFNTVTAQQVVINEVMSSNKTTIYDEDSDTPDWIEIFNSGENTVNLNGFGITDNINNPDKWIFPEVQLEPDSFILVFASGKDRNFTGGYWETIIDWADVWKYIVPDSEIPSNWAGINFDDSSWPVGPSGFGYGDGDDNTFVSQTMSVYIRNIFLQLN